MSGRGTAGSAGVPRASMAWQYDESSILEPGSADSNVVRLGSSGRDRILTPGTLTVS